MSPPLSIMNNSLTPLEVSNLSVSMENSFALTLSIPLKVRVLIPT